MGVLTHGRMPGVSLLSIAKWTKKRAMKMARFEKLRETAGQIRVSEQKGRRQDRERDRLPVMETPSEDANGNERGGTNSAASCKTRAARSAGAEQRACGWRKVGQ
jgi:hypothetical protein